MVEKRWREADEKNRRFILYLARGEKQQILLYPLELDDIKNFKCEDLKKLDSLWVKNSQGHFGYSVQKKIYLRFGNSLDFDWEKGQWRKWNENGYNKFAESVGWKKEGGDSIRYEELPMNLENPREEAPEGMLPRLTLPLRSRRELMLSVGGRMVMICGVGVMVDDLGRVRSAATR